MIDFEPIVMAVILRHFTQGGRVGSRDNVSGRDLGETPAETEFRAL